MRMENSEATATATATATTTASATTTRTDGANDMDNYGTTKGASCTSSSASTSATAAVPMPKHIPFPEMPVSSELLNEFIMFAFVMFAATMQFINIYRTVWWLPESYTNHTLNFYLIEPYLFVLIVLMTARRLMYCLCIRLLDLVQNNKQKRSYRKMLRYGYSICLLSLFSFCIAKICARHTYFSFFLLIYPFVVYLLIFGFQIEPFLRSALEVEGSYFNGMPMHCCSSNPVTIRDEIEVLKNDFNNRFKQVIFTSVLNAYYAGFLPCFYASSVYYNVLWVTQHIVFVWLSGMMMGIMFIFPSKYTDILHRAALHLGVWSRYDVRPGIVSLPGVTLWSRTIAWSNGSIVKQDGSLLRSFGPVTVAIPGNVTHSRFYHLFYNPSLIYMVLTSLQAAIVVAQISLLFYSVEWHFVLSISFVALTNQFTFFKTTRDFLVTKRIYTSETAIFEKQY